MPVSVSGSTDRAGVGGGFIPPAAGAAGRSRRPAALALYAAIAVQFLCAAIFIGFFFVDVAGIGAAPISYTLRELVQIAAGLGLVISIALNIVLIRRQIARSQRLEQSLALARGAFHDLVQQEFTAWGLTPAEREVALFAIKGLSNAEIAQVTGKSEGTVKSQSNAVFRKSGCSGRVALVTHFMDELIGEGADQSSGDEASGGASAA